MAPLTVDPRGYPQSPPLRGTLPSLVTQLSAHVYQFVIRPNHFVALKILRKFNLSSHAPPFIISAKPKLFYSLK